MNALRETLSQNWIGTTLGMVGIIVGIVVAYVFKPRPRLFAQINTLELLGPNAVLPNEVEFLFRGEKVPNVTMSRIAIWNGGNTTITAAQMIAKDALRVITSQNSRILEASIRIRSRAVNGFECTIREVATNEGEFRFDFLDPGDGAVIQLFHTGSDKIRVVGTIQGIPKGIRVNVVRKPKPEEHSHPTAFGVKLAGLLSSIFGLLFAWMTLVILPPAYYPLSYYVLLWFTGMPFLFTAVMLFFGRYLPPSPLNTQITTITANEPNTALQERLRKWFGWS